MLHLSTIAATTRSVNATVPLGENEDEPDVAGWRRQGVAQMEGWAGRSSLQDVDGSGDDERDGGE